MSCVDDNHRGSMNIWIKRVLDDASSVSSLQTLEASSSFYSSVYSSNNDGCSTVVSFDWSLIRDDDDSSEDSLSVHDHQEQDQEQQPQNPPKDWRWESDPNLPLQRDLGKRVDAPFICPPRRWSSKSSLKNMRSATKLLPTKKKSQSPTRIDRRKISSPNRPRMPQRQVSDASGMLLGHCSLEEPALEEEDVTKTNTSESPKTPPPEPAPLFLPTRRIRKLPTSRPIQRRARPSRQIPTRGRSGNTIEGSQLSH